MRLPVVGSSALATGSRLPTVGQSPFTDMLSRIRGLRALEMATIAKATADGAQGTARWGRVKGDIYRQEDLQEEFAVSNHALCGGI